MLGPLICRLMQLLMQFNVVIRERERLSACEYLRGCLCASLSSVQRLSTNSKSLS